MVWAVVVADAAVPDVVRPKLRVENQGKTDFVEDGQQFFPSTLSIFLRPDSRAMLMGSLSFALDQCSGSYWPGAALGTLLTWMGSLLGIIYSVLSFFSALSCWNS